MNYLSVEQLSKTWQDEPVLNKISFGIAKGEKVALVANNGSGKTSLLNILLGLDKPDHGSAIIRKDIVVGYLPQEPKLNSNFTVVEQLFSHQNEITKAIIEYDKAVEQLNLNNTTENQLQFDVAINIMNDLDAWDYESRIKLIASKLEIDTYDQPISQLSGGQQKRVALAQVLISNPDLIILDEPTNHLDFDMIEWLEQYLSQKDLSLLLVSHDRYFLDRVCSQIIELHRASLYHYKGNYSYFLENKALREQIEESEFTKTKNLYNRELDWVRRMPKARTTKNKSRVDAFDQVKNKLSNYKQKQELNLSMRMERLGSKVLEMHQISKAFGNKQLISKFNYVFKKGEKVGILGKNGSGKSTLLKMITGELIPDTGKIITGETIVFGHYSQDSIFKDESRKIIDVVRDVADFFTNADGHKITAMSLLKHFGFSPLKQQNYVYSLSGGEKRRLQLMCVLMLNPNFIILDEPTNDLDIDTLVKLEDFLVSFNGCLIVVSHDRFFMDRIVDHLFVLNGNGEVQDFPGNYSEYRDWKDLQDEPQIAEIETKTQVVEMAPVKTIKQKLSFKEQFELDQIEKTIPDLQNQISKTENELIGLTSEFEKINELTTVIFNLKKQVEIAEFRWMELEEIKNQGSN